MIFSYVIHRQRGVLLRGHTIYSFDDKASRHIRSLPPRALKLATSFLPDGSGHRRPRPCLCIPEFGPAPGASGSAGDDAAGAPSVPGTGGTRIHLHSSLHSPIRPERLRRASARVPVHWPSSWLSVQRARLRCKWLRQCGLPALHPGRQDGCRDGSGLSTGM